MYFFFFQAEDGIRDLLVTGVQTCALPISREPGTGSDIHAFETLLDAFVGIALARFQLENAVADDGEAEMSRLDGAGMDRPDHDFVHAVTFHTNEGIGIGFREGEAVSSAR